MDPRAAGQPTTETNENPLPKNGKTISYVEGQDRPERRNATVAGTISIAVERMGAEEALMVRKEPGAVFVSEYDLKPE